MHWAEIIFSFLITANRGGAWKSHILGPTWEASLGLCASLGLESGSALSPPCGGSDHPTLPFPAPPPRLGTSWGQPHALIDSWIFRFACSQFLQFRCLLSTTKTRHEAFSERMSSNECSTRSCLWWSFGSLISTPSPFSKCHETL